MAKDTTPKKTTTKSTNTAVKKPTTKAAAASGSKAADAKTTSSTKKIVKDEKTTKLRVPKVRKPSAFVKNFPAIAKTAYYTVWTLLGLALIVASILSFVNEEPLVETLNISESSATTAGAGAGAPPPPPGGPTDEQLDCVAEALGQERFEELRQGFPPDEAEAATIDQCFSS